MKHGTVSFRLGLSFLALLLLAPLAASGPAPELEPYREFVRTPRARDLLAIARDAMRGYWGEGADRARKSEPDWPSAPTGIYLTLAEGSATRACVGRAFSDHGPLAEAVRDLAIQALQADTRRPPVRREELDRLRIVITFAGNGDPVDDPMDVDPGREGLLISSEGKSVAFLPGEARTVAWALREARRVGVLQGSPEHASYVRFPIVALAEPPAVAPSTNERDSNEPR